MVITRSFSPIPAERALSRVVLPEPVPPEITIETRAATAPFRNSATQAGMAPTPTSLSRSKGFLENFRMETAAPSMAMGKMAAFTRLPSARRASTMGWLSSIRRPTAATMRLTMRSRWSLSRNLTRVHSSSPRRST